MWTYEKPDNLVEWWMESERRFQDNVLFRMHGRGGSLEAITYGEIGRRIALVRGGLARLGIGKGDAVGVISANRPEWAVLAFAAYGRRARFIPMYEQELPQTWRYIIGDGAVKFLLVSNEAIYEQVKDFPREIGTLEHIYIMEGQGENSLAALEREGEGHPVDPEIPHHDDIAVLIYTSGTIAEPKGVLLTHGNLTYCSKAGYKIYPELNEGSVAISMLPWAHSYALSAELNNWIQFGGSIGFMRDVSTLTEDIKRIKPHYLICVPRLFNKIYDGIQMQMSDAGGIKKKLFDAACAAARKKRELAGQGRMSRLTDLRVAILDRLVFSKIRAALGGRVVGSLTASAVMNREIAEFFNDVGVPIYDCYGLTEAAPAITMNSRGGWRIGSVGQVLEGQRVVIDRSAVEDGASDGEIIAYGPNIMKGYHNKPEQTAGVLMADGGLRTGDRGYLDAEGYLWITGRIKEQFKLLNGKYVFPAAIEEEIKLLPHVANAMIHGDGKPYNICLVVPDFEVAARWAAERGVSNLPGDLLANREFTEMIEGAIVRILTGTFGKYEIPRKFIFLEEDFTVENRMLTQTMKVKRRVVLNRYDEQIEALYA